MSKYPKIRRPESNKDTWFFIRFYLITAILIIVSIIFAVWVVSSLFNTYKNGLDTCMEKGYSKEYCQSMLN